MARLIARRDTAEGYVFVASGDGFVIPEGARNVMKRHGGEFNPNTKEWRVGVHDGPAIVAAFQAAGHHVITKDATDKPVRRQLLECSACALPYRDVSPLTSSCNGCGEALKLVPPHGCDDQCRANSSHGNWGVR